jgi:hypothetical protein
MQYSINQLLNYLPAIIITLYAFAFYISGMQQADDMPQLGYGETFGGSNVLFDNEGMFLSVDSRKSSFIVIGAQMVLQHCQEIFVK